MLDAYRVDGPFIGLSTLILLSSNTFSAKKTLWLSSDTYLHTGAKELKKKETNKELNFSLTNFILHISGLPLYFLKSPCASFLQRHVNISRKLGFLFGISSFSSFQKSVLWHSCKEPRWSIAFLGFLFEILKTNSQPFLFEIHLTNFYQLWTHNTPMWITSVPWVTIGDWYVKSQLCLNTTCLGRFIWYWHTILEARTF